MASETIALDGWVRATLAADTALVAALGAERIFAERIPQGAPLPAVLFQAQALEDRLTASARRMYTDALYLVRAIAPATSFASLEVVAERIDVVLNNASGSFDGRSIFDCYRERPFRLVEEDNAIEYRHVGGMYRIHIS